ncbi:MAG: hypothetical protein AOA65_1563 [Candidatus Bathyarchaeota archaeon BA1]|nr:MAG: hypothetical protein AOA65_1563 [Candidatus Bathyarchaeota archaeon BA1]
MGATVRATDALILDRRGFVPTGPTAMPDRRRALHEIYGKEPIVVKGKPSTDFTPGNGCCMAHAPIKAFASPR